MKLFRLPKRDRRYMDDETPLLRFFRYIIIALLFCGVIWGFWINNERRMEMLKKPQPARIDNTGALSDGQQRELAHFQSRFRDAYGLSMVILVRDERFAQPFLQSGERAGTVFLGLVPRARQVVFELPPLAEAALGEELARYLRQEHFMPYFADGNWPEGLAKGLNMITRRFDDVLLAGQGQRLP